VIGAVALALIVAAVGYVVAVTWPSTSIKEAPISLALVSGDQAALKHELCTVSLALVSGDQAALKHELCTVLKAQHAAIKAGELDIAMGLVHRASPVRATTREVLSCAIAYGPPQIEVGSAVLLPSSDREARLQTTQHYRWNGSQFYRDSIASEVHYFRKEAGTWKLWKTECDQKVAIQ